MRRLKYTALHRAVLDCRVAQVRLLIEQCGADVDSRDLYGRTPLMLCCALDNHRAAAAMAKLLLAAGPDLTVKDDLGRTALAHACLFGREALIARLADSPGVVLDPTEPDHDGCTPLHHAAEQGNSRIVCLLVRACAEGRSNVDCRNRLGCTPLMLACRLRRYHSALFLLLDGGASGFLKDNAHFLSALEWLRRAELTAGPQHQHLDQHKHQQPPPPLRRAETAPLPQPHQHQHQHQHQQHHQPPTFITEYSSLGGGGGGPRGLTRSRTMAAGAGAQPPLVRPLPPPADCSGSSAGSRPATTAGSGSGSGRGSRYTSATGDTVYVNVDELSPRAARDLLMERLRAQAIQFPYPTAVTAKPQALMAPMVGRPATRDLQAMRPPPRSSAVANACQLLGLYHAAMTAPKPAHALTPAELAAVAAAAAATSREGTGISELSVGAAASEAAAGTGAAGGNEKAASASVRDRDRRTSLLAQEMSAKDKKSVKFKDVSK